MYSRKLMFYYTCKVPDREKAPLVTVQSVLARQPSRAADPLLHSSRGGGGGRGTPPVYWQAGGGDL